MPDVMVAKLDEAIEALPGNGSTVEPLPLSERAAKLAEIEREIFALEIQEEALISAAHRDGVTVERRFEQSPASILGVQIVNSSRARAA